jgi:hypothetical protein
VNSDAANNAIDAPAESKSITSLRSTNLKNHLGVSITLQPSLRPAMPSSAHSLPLQTIFCDAYEIRDINFIGLTYIMAAEESFAKWWRQREDLLLRIRGAEVNVLIYYRDGELAGGAAAVS